MTTLINIDVTDNPLDMADVVALLELNGLDTKKEIVNDILDRKDESFPFLARIATSQEYWQGDYADGWSQICAIHLLGKMKHYQAQLAVNSALLEYYDDIGGWLTDDAPYVLAHMGVDAIPTLTALMRYGGADMFVRGCAVDALVMIIKRHPETKPGIIASVMDAGRKESNIEARSILVDSLVNLLDPDLYEYLKDSLKTGFILSSAYTQETIERVYADQNPSYGDARDPLYIFGPQFKNSL